MYKVKRLDTPGDIWEIFGNVKMLEESLEQVHWDFYIITLQNLQRAYTCMKNFKFLICFRN